MPKCTLDESIERQVVGTFAYPLGAYPVEPSGPRQGYSLDFEPADGDDESGDWEEWPDRYVFDIVISAERVPALWNQLRALLPGRVYPILDFIGHDAFREIDPYISYELVGLDRVTDAVRAFGPFLFEDGMVGFGAVAEDPFVYIFVDEHKIVTVRVQPTLKERVEEILKAFDLSEVAEPAGADAVAHEHRSVLLAPDDRPDLLTPEEIVERLRDEWRLVLNVDAESNVDDAGNDLGPTWWRCLVRCQAETLNAGRYAEVIGVASNLLKIEDLAQEAALELIGTPGEWSDIVVVSADRTTEREAQRVLRDAGASVPASDPSTSEATVLSARWLG